MSKSVMATVIILWLALLSGLYAVTCLVANSAPSWDARTCSAFQTWVHHPSPSHLRTLDLDSQHADPFLKIDVNWLYEDVRHHATRYIAAREYYVHLDCTIGADE